MTPPPTVAAKQAAPPPQRPLVQAASASDPGDFFLLQKKRRLQAAVPVEGAARLLATARPSSRDSNAFRVYPLRQARQGAGGRRAAPALDSSHAWGLRYTTWIDAPILEQPTRQVCWDKHQVRVYTNGAAIHRIAVFYGGERVQGGRRGRRLDRQLARRQAVARDDDRDRAQPASRRTGRRRPDPRHGARRHEQRTARRDRRRVRRPRDRRVLRAVGLRGHVPRHRRGEARAAARRRDADPRAGHAGGARRLARAAERSRPRRRSCSRAPTSRSCASTRRRARRATPI